MIIDVNQYPHKKDNGLVQIDDYDAGTDKFTVRYQVFDAETQGAKNDQITDDQVTIADIQQKIDAVLQAAAAFEAAGLLMIADLEDFQGD